MTVTVQTPYAAWQSEYFTAAELNNPSISGPNAAPAGDGITNLMKYALGLSPKASGTAGMPTVSATTTGGKNYLTLTYLQALTATDITYTVEISPDLVSWSSGANSTVVVSTSSNPDGKTRTVVMRDLTAQTGAARRFMRLAVSQPSLGFVYRLECALTGNGLSTRLLRVVPKCKVQRPPPLYILRKADLQIRPLSQSPETSRQAAKEES